MIITAPASAINDTAISNDEFYPAIQLDKIRAENRIDSTITKERLSAAVIEAIATVNTQLKTLKETTLSMNIAHLADIPAEQINQKSILEHRYLRAIGCLTKANLVERYRDFDSTTQGNRNADELLPNIDELRRDAHWAISDILGKPRSVIELI